MLTLENVRQIRDEKFLAKIAKTSEGVKNNGKYIRREICEQAVSQIESEEILKDIILESISKPSKFMVASIAIEKISDEKICEYILSKKEMRNAEYSYKYFIEYKDLCLAASKKIKNQETLKKLAMDDPDERIRVNAINALEDEETLKYIISNNKEEKNVRKIANNRLIAIECHEKTQNEIMNIYENSDDLDLKIKILKYIENGDMMKKIVTTEDEWRLRKVAVTKIFDNQLLLKIALKDKTKNVRASACMNITSPQYLEEIILNSGDDTITEIAIKKLNKMSYKH